MKPWMKYPVVLALGGVFVLVVASANSMGKLTADAKSKQIVVLVYPVEKGLRFEIESPEYRNGEYKKLDANYLLAEVKLHEGGDCQIIELVDDRAPLSAITDASEMAINAGFKDIRPFVYWHKTGKMAQVLFGPPIKFTTNAEKIEQKEKAR